VREKKVVAGGGVVFQDVEWGEKAEQGEEMEYEKEGEGDEEVKTEEAKDEDVEMSTSDKAISSSSSSESVTPSPRAFNFTDRTPIGSPIARPSQPASKYVRHTERLGHQDHLPTLTNAVPVVSWKFQELMELTLAWIGAIKSNKSSGKLDEVTETALKNVEAEYEKCVGSLKEELVAVMGAGDEGEECGKVIDEVMGAVMMGLGALGRRRR
jgi:hypothetical protein